MKTEINVKKKLPNKLHRPYVRNTLTFRSELYPNDSSARPVMHASTTGSFTVRLLPLLAALGGLCTLLYCMTVRKFKK